ncbi:MAG: hypothetical protein ACOC16_00205 [Nanoarchaeota archaeon]
MFEIELLDLINKAKKTQDNYELNNIKDSISNLIFQNNDEFNKFISKNDIDMQTQEFLKSCIKKTYKNDENKFSDSKSDLDNIKNYYMSWLEHYNKNNNVVDDNCNMVIDEIINFYVLNRFNVILSILKIVETQDYEAFKWHLKNKLRLYFSNQIRNYIKSSNYQNLNFFKKIRKKNAIHYLISAISKYEFDIKLINEVLENEY